MHLRWYKAVALCYTVSIADSSLGQVAFVAGSGELGGDRITVETRILSGWLN